MNNTPHRWRFEYPVCTNGLDRRGQGNVSAKLLSIAWNTCTKFLFTRAISMIQKGWAILADIVLKQQKRVKKVLADLGYHGFFEDIIRRIHL